MIASAPPRVKGPMGWPDRQPMRVSAARKGRAARIIRPDPQPAVRLPGCSSQAASTPCAMSASPMPAPYHS